MYIDQSKGKGYRITKKENHSWERFSQKTGLSGFQYCGNCGLVALRNEATQKAIRKGCTIKEDM